MKEAIKQRILDAVSIDHYIGRSVALKKQGQYLKGLCPFHGEKTPSFTVTPEKGIYHCFGCGRSGDLFSFVMEKEGVSFPEAIEILANYAGIPLDQGKSAFHDEGGHSSVYFDILAKARTIYHNYLHSTDGIPFLQYLQSRGVRIETIEKFRIGAVSDEWQNLVSQFPESEQNLIDIGLARRSDTGRVYDFFRNRLMFPIEDISDRCIGFGGRVVVADEMPKYINSPDSSVFHKGRILFGLNHAIPHLRKNRRSFLVEGYLDVIGLYQAGIYGAVAPLGTAFTEDHASLISRYSDEIYIFLDGDRAGRLAAAKAARTLVATNRAARVLFLPSGMDPFDFSNQTDAVSIFEKLVEFSIPASRFLLISTLEDETLSSIFNRDLPPVEYMRFLSENMGVEDTNHRLQTLEIEDRKQSLVRLTEMLHTLTELDRSLLIDEAALMLGVEPKIIKTELTKRNRPVVSHTSYTAQPKQVAPSSHLVRIERELLAYLFLNPDLFPVVYHSLKQIEFEDSASEIFWRILEDRFTTDQTWQGELNEMSDLPAFVRDLFVPLVLKHSQSRTDKITQEILLELSIKHSLERVEQELKEKETELQFADDPQPVALAMHGLQKEKLRLKMLLRSGVN
ncbi:MAG: DNA primase [Leptonema sp. (in: Bacteria)]|nr:DNA primase [Leptonema sp. (in: bacteria)]